MRNAKKKEKENKKGNLQCPYTYLKKKYRQLQTTNLILNGKILIFYPLFIDPLFI